MFRKLTLTNLLLVVTLFLVACSTAVNARSNVQAKSNNDAGKAALAGLQAIGWDITGFTAEIEVVDGDYARVLIHSSNPPGGFTAFLQRKADGWQVIAHGSAFNPVELQGLGIPDSVLGPLAEGLQPQPGEEDLVAGATLLGLELIGWDVDGFSAEVQQIDGDYARVLVHSSNPPGGFTAFLQRKADGWQVIAHGSAFNPAELQEQGIPNSLLP